MNNTMNNTMNNARNNTQNVRNTKNTPTVNNVMADNPDYFKLSQSRTTWCWKWHLLPVYNCKCQPNSQYIVYPSTQFFMAACWTDEAKARIDKGEEVKRCVDNLMPTAFVYESDKLNLPDQIRNIKPGATTNILSITHSGNKSFHIIVPIHLSDSYKIGGDRELYKYLWHKVASRLFKDVSVLDAQCASIGRLSRMPGALRLKSIHGKYLDTNNTKDCKEQRCVFLNEDVKTVDLRSFFDAYTLKAMGAQIRNTLLDAKQKRLAKQYEGRSKGEKNDPLQHLIHTAKRYPTACKETAVNVLVNNDIPSSDKLPENGSYISTIWYLKNKFPTLVEEFVTKVKQAHPSCLPKPVNKYL